MPRDPQETLVLKVVENGPNQEKRAGTYFGKCVICQKHVVCADTLWDRVTGDNANDEVKQSVTDYTLTALAVLQETPQATKPRPFRLEECNHANALRSLPVVLPCGHVYHLSCALNTQTKPHIPSIPPDRGGIETPGFCPQDGCKGTVKIKLTKHQPPTEALYDNQGATGLLDEPAGPVSVKTYSTELVSNTLVLWLRQIFPPPQVQETEFGFGVGDRLYLTPVAGGAGPVQGGTYALPGTAPNNTAPNYAKVGDGSGSDDNRDYLAPVPGGAAIYVMASADATGPGQAVYDTASPAGAPTAAGTAVYDQAAGPGQAIYDTASSANVPAGAGPAFYDQASAGAAGPRETIYALASEATIAEGRQAINEATKAAAAQVRSERRRSGGSPSGSGRASPGAGSYMSVGEEECRLGFQAGSDEA